MTSIASAAGVVERVARAIRARKFARTGRHSAIAEMDPPTQNELDDARAAIDAMREPTETMISAGLGNLDSDASYTLAGDVWRAMIDAALNRAEGK